MKKIMCTNHVEATDWMADSNCWLLFSNQNFELK